MPRHFDVLPLSSRQVASTTVPSNPEASPSLPPLGSPGSPRMVSRYTRWALTASVSRRPSSSDGDLLSTPAMSPISGAPTAGDPPCSGGSRLITPTEEQRWMGWSTPASSAAPSAEQLRSSSEALLERLGSQLTTPGMSWLRVDVHDDRDEHGNTSSAVYASVGTVQRIRGGRHRGSRRSVLRRRPARHGRGGGGWLQRLRGTAHRFLGGNWMFWRRDALTSGTSASKMIASRQSPLELEK